MTVEQLALNGGPQTKTTPYATGDKHDAGGEAEALRKALEGKERLPMAMGPNILELRRQVCELFGVEHCIPCSSGTAAIHAGLAALGIGPGDEVITTPSSDHGTAIGIMQLGAIPVFADVNLETMMIDADTIEPRITDRTRAILPVHGNGCPADMDGIMALARRSDLKVLEDCAQSWLARWGDRYVGTHGDAGIFSMNESKHISCGEGGIIITDDDEAARFADQFVDKSYNRTGVGPVAPSMPALNVRLSEINAVLALEQLKKVRSLVDRRHELGEKLAAGIDDLPGVRVHRVPAEKGFCSYWYAVVRLFSDEAGLTVEQMVEALKAEGIQAGPSNARSMFDWPLFQKLNEDPEAFATYRAPGLTKGRFDSSTCPNCAKLAGTSFTVKMNEHSSDEDIEQTIAAIRKVSAWYRSQVGAAG